MSARKAPTDIGERIRAVEVNVEQLLKDGLRREEQLDDVAEELKDINAAIQEFKLEMARYKGAFGALLLLLSGVATALSWLGAPLWAWIRGTKAS